LEDAGHALVKNVFGDFSEMDQKVEQCPCCGAQDMSPRFKIRDYRYLECNGCGLLFLPSSDVLASSSGNLYDSDYFENALKEGLRGYMDYAMQEQALRKNFRRYFSLIRPHLRTNGFTMLDIGCAYGFLLDEARELGAKVYGVDCSSAAIDWMKNHLGISGTVGFLSDAPKGQFDVISASEVIEHVHDLHGFMQDLIVRLKPGGLAVLVTGARDAPLARTLAKYWWYLNPPDHCAIFTRKALKLIVSNHGLEVVVHRLFPYHWVGLDNGLLKVARIFNWPWMGKVARKASSYAVPIPHYSTQFLIARRPT
jgi:SAM-dependent methyltransferase